MSEVSKSASALVQAQGFEATLFSGDAGRSTVATARERDARRIVVDLAHVDTLSDRRGFVGYLEKLYKAGIATAVIEGGDEECFSLSEVLPASVVVVPYFRAETRKYLTLPRVKIYAGAQYFPFRNEFSQTRGSRPAPAQARRILVSFGGGDVRPYNAKIIEALALIQRDDLEIDITGEAGTSRMSGNIRIAGAASDMASLIGSADLAVIGSGLTRYETALLGTPALVYSLQVAHVPMVEEFETSGAIEHGGVMANATPADIASALSRLIGDHSSRIRMAKAGPQITDGKGAARLAEAIGALSA